MLHEIFATARFKERHHVVRPQVWVVDDTGFPKDGRSSPGVARQYSGTLGKVGNCQIGVSVHAASDTASCPLSWRLFLPESWDGTGAAGRREACRIPATEHHRPKWQLALNILDELAATGLRPAVLVADTGYGANADFRHGLEDRGLAYVLQAKAEMTAHGQDAEPHQPEYGGRGPRPMPRYRTRPVSLREHVLAAGRGRGRTVVWRKGSKAALSSHFVLLRVRLAGRRPKPAPDGKIPLVWLIAQWPEGESEPVKYWISNLPADIPAKDLVRLAKARWRIEHDYHELKRPWAWTTSRAVPSPAGTGTSPSSPPPTCSSPNSGPAQKPLPGPDPLPGPGPPPTPHRHLDRHLPHLPTGSSMAALRHQLTKHY
ncbi:IS701 family transposase [Streptomyces lavendulae]|uniref:IS701 family transposase n=1 Tax=Streptomyces lavendulae TaxID=1914 RepID=UPI00369C70A1